MDKQRRGPAKQPEHDAEKGEKDKVVLVGAAGLYALQPIAVAPDKGRQVGPGACCQGERIAGGNSTPHINRAGNPVYKHLRNGRDAESGPEQEPSEAAK